MTVPELGSPSGRCDEASLSARLSWPPPVSRSSAALVMVPDLGLPSGRCDEANLSARLLAAPRLRIERGARDGARVGFALWSVR